MKHILCLLLCLALVFGLFACGQTTPDPTIVASTITGAETTAEKKATLNDGIRAFSYEQDVARYSVDDWGIHREGFHNATESIISSKEDAIRLAKNEVSIAYDEASVDYDDTCDMWRIGLFNFDSGYPQTTVYLTGKGITTLIFSH